MRVAQKYFAIVFDLAFRHCCDDDNDDDDDD